MLFLLLLLSLLPGPQDPAGDAAVEAGPPVETADAAEEARSLLTEPLYLGEKPETRSLRHILVLHRDVLGVGQALERTEEEALELARGLAARLEAGADFADLARRRSEAPTARTGGILGTFAPGMLDAAFDEFLFEAEIGEWGGPYAAVSGVHLLQRIDTLAGARQILVRGDEERARARCLELLARVRSGEDFGELAEIYSEDEVSSARRGQLAIFERGPFDALLKRAAFEVEVGEIAGPIQSPLGYHLVQRVPVSEVDPSLRDLTWIRARSILLSFEGAPDFPKYVDRSEPEAAELIQELHDRILAGEDMGDLAARYDDDFGGRERRGDLGWVHRRTPRMSTVLDQLYLKPAGELLDPIRVPQGWILLRREQ